MPKRIAREEMRKVTVSGYMPIFLQGFLHAEAAKQDIAPSMLVEKMAAEYLESRGYPIGETYQDDTDAAADAKALFLREYAQSVANVTSAAKAAGVSTTTVYQWVGEDSYFAEAFSIAKRRKHPNMTPTANLNDYSEHMARTGKAQAIGQRGRQPAREIGPDGQILEPNL